MLVSFYGQGRVAFLLFPISMWIIAFSNGSDSSSHKYMDVLSPYLSHHGPRHRRHQDTQACQDVLYGNVTHSLHPAINISHPSPVLPLVETYYKARKIGSSWQKKYVNVHHFIVNNPLTSLSVLEPGFSGSCQTNSSTLTTVRESSHQKNCLVSVNGGFFNTHTGECYGNIVRDGYIVHNSEGIQNAHFGITKKGQIYTGYLSELDLIAQGFVQLVGGVIWLVRDGKNFVEESKKLECSDTEETGTMERFASVTSARTSIGHDKEGRVHITQVNGKTDISGVNLNELADLLIEFGIVNAINLDGGGSSTAVVNGSLVSFPSDHCQDKINNCERAVSTIVCAHEPACPGNCSGHGVCQIGMCQCRKPWTGQACNVLDPSINCGIHGQLHGDHCVCDKGWIGQNCSFPCPSGTYGENCLKACLCAQSEECDVITGACHCGPGQIGKYCEKKCPYGYYGQDCAEVCFCQDACFCDAVNGSCNVTEGSEDYIRAGKCLARKQIAEEQLVPDRQNQYSMCLTSLVCLTIIAVASLVLNAVFSVMLFKKKKKKEPAGEKIPLKRLRRRRKRPKTSRILSSSSDVEIPMANGFLNRGTAEEQLTLTGSGEDEEDVFLSRKKAPFS